MNNRYLLDTNIAIAFLANDASVRRQLKGVASFISVVSAAELLHGAFKSDERARNLQAVRAYLAVQSVLNCDLVTAERYSLIRLDLEQRVEKIPENDLWIAAHAMQHGLTLASRDSHFSRVMHLPLATW